MGRRKRWPRDPMAVYDLLRRLGHAGTEDELAERVIEAAPTAGVRPDAIAADMPSSAPCGSVEWRRNRAVILSTIIACIARTGRLGCLVAGAGVPSWEPDCDRVEPGTADGEGDGRPMRYDRIYTEEVGVTVGDEAGTVRFPAFDGRVRVERGGGQATVAALDDLSEDDRRALARTPVRRRVEVHVRCSVREGCGEAFRCWISQPMSGGEGKVCDIVVEDTGGERVCGFAELFAAKCPAHRRGRQDGM